MNNKALSGLVDANRRLLAAVDVRDAVKRAHEALEAKDFDAAAAGIKRAFDAISSGEGNAETLAKEAGDLVRRVENAIASLPVASKD